MKKELTEKQAAALECIKSFIQERSYSPTTRELAKELGYQSTSTVHSLLDKLAEKGYISKETSGPRTIRVLKGSEPGVDELNKEIDQLHEVIESQETVMLRNFDLAKELERVMEERDKLAVELKFYADPATYDIDHLDKHGYIIIDMDGGKRARRALGI